MILDVYEFAVLVYPFERMAAVAVKAAPALWCAVVGEEHHASMVTFWCVRKQVEGGIVVQQEVIGSSRLGANDVGTLDRITAEKDGEVEADDVVVALAGIELDGETARITS